ncbi:D-alanyl-D-alanine carboxypeptidase [Candidatus Saccharibacteria bacterium]|nr:MAG: D-alanyl-D-alanine carboxypeptidase [Candidatus Saccharibacteria bacterium]
MRIIEPHQLRTVRYRGSAQQRRIKVVPLLLIVVLLASLGFGYWRFQRPIALPVTQVTQQSYTKKDPGFVWPINEQAAVAGVGYGVLGSSPNQKQVPIASITKVITALAVLKQKPLLPGQQGEAITVTEQDVLIYNKYVAQGGAVIPVSVGGSLTQYQLMQAMLIPSANNAAEMLVNWAFGSEADYITYANAMLADMGLKATRVADASGFSPQSVSTASDLTQIGVTALKEPTIAEIVASKQVTLPMAGVINSTNFLLGEPGIIGIKTGNTDEAGGCFMAAVTQPYEGGQTVSLVAVVLGAPQVTDAMNMVKPLLTKAKQGFGKTIVVAAGQQFGTITAAWGEKTIVAAPKNVVLFGWQYGSPSFTTTLSGAENGAGKVAGITRINFGSQKVTVPLVQDKDLGEPDLVWRLKRIF